MNNPTAALASLIIGGGLGFLASQLLTGAPENKSGLGMTSEVNAGATDPIASLRAENQDLKARIQEMESALARNPLKKPPEEESASDEAAQPDAADPVEVAFGSDEFAQALAKIDWGVVGTNMKDMVPLLAKLAEAIANGEQPDLEQVGEIQKLNAELLKLAQIVSNEKIPGSGINGAFTHPVLAANQIHAALSAAGHALDDDQHAALDRIMKEYAAKDSNLRIAEGDTEMQLEALAQEVQLKHEFYAQAKGLLNKDQFDTLYHNSSTGHAGLDLFGTGLMLSQYAKPIGVTSASQMATKTTQVMSSQLGLTGEAAKQLESTVSKWSQSYPASYWETKAGALERNNMMKTSRIQDALTRQVQLRQMILQNVTLTAAQRKQLQQGRQIFVPLPR